MDDCELAVFVSEWKSDTHTCSYCDKLVTPSGLHLAFSMCNRWDRLQANRDPELDKPKRTECWNEYGISTVVIDLAIPADSSIRKKDHGKTEVPGTEETTRVNV